MPIRTGIDSDSDPDPDSDSDNDLTDRQPLPGGDAFLEGRILVRS
ncbi:MAG: hypothetical protein PHF14_04935 [Verrucomicrobiota bacterium]|nr:hypothetical protein [Verrucomicrobiota bacterium]MDD8045792.1 hypothetical protein [Verrucomicrobiota bacterium]